MVNASCIQLPWLNPSGNTGMPYIDGFRTLRVAAGLKKAVVARTAGISADTVDRIEKHHNSTHETLTAAVHALNTLYYNREGKPLDPLSLITETTAYGGSR
jgi:DNA-binding XRE family transcriptional regulator